MDQHRRSRGVGLVYVCLWSILIAGIGVWWLWPRPVLAQQRVSDPDSVCRLCHIGMEGVLTLPSGETITLGIELEPLEQSVHGQHTTEDILCTDCHGYDPRAYQYPHEPNPAQTRQEFEAQFTPNCEQCHMPLELHNPGHLLAEPGAEVPGCVACHGGHEVTPVTEFADDTTAFCQSCHQTFKDDMVGSVHAELAANFGPEQNCLTCHGDEPQPADTKCQTCHTLLTRDVVLSSGEVVDLTVNPEDILNSVHGEREVDGVHQDALQCVDCHQDIERYGFPHPPLNVETRRELTLEMQGVCQSCHEEITEQQRDSVHADALAHGVLDAATCFDCHGNHAIQDPNEPRAQISQTCGQCHGEIQAQYVDSVHGAALVGEDNPDVPVCIDCHGVHEIHDPTTAQFRLQSPEMCAGCHADEEIMNKYDISTQVFDTYVTDFHGTTIKLFEKQSPDQPTNKAVCYDCHGVHDILAPTDENSHVIKANLLETCQQCHPDATTNFPDSWMSHFEASPDHNPLVYWINIFYRILIPTVVGAMVLFIGTDIFRRTWNRLRTRR